MLWSRLDLPQIERTLRVLGGEAAAGRLDPTRSGEPVTDDVLRRLLGGYRYVDGLLAERAEIFAYGRTGHILELNHQVLCGIDPERRRQFADHIAETERWFYDRPDGIGSLFDWYRMNATRPPRTLAAGLIVQVISTPQLFIEGNGRTATLLASYALARAGLPPLVLTAESYPRYRESIGRCAALDRHGFASVFAILLATHRVSGALQELCDARFLLREPAGQAPVDASAPGLPQ